MFHFEAISTANVISLVQIIVVLGGFYFSWKSLEATRASVGIAGNNLQIAAQSVNTASQNLKLSTDNAQAQLYNQMLTQGRTLQVTFMDNFVGEQEKAEYFMGVIIAYYAGCFELRRVLSLPATAASLLDNDVRESMRDASFRAKWEQLEHLYSADFGAYVRRVRGVPVP